MKKILHTCKKPSSFMKHVKDEKWTCPDCGKKWVWEIRWFAVAGAWFEDWKRD